MADLSATGMLRRVDAVTWLTLYLVVLFAIPSWLVVAPLGSAGALSMLMGLVSLALWFLFRVGVWQASDLELRPMRMALALFLFSVGVSYVVTMARPIEHDEISPADNSILSLLAWSGTLLIAHDGITDLRRLNRLVWRASWCGGAMAVLGIAQFLTGQTIVDRISVPGLTAVSAAGTATRNGLIRPAGTAGSPIEYGTLLSMLLPLALYVGFHERSRPLVVRWVPALAIGAIIVASSSRSALLGAVIGVGLAMIGWQAKHRRVVLALSLTGLAFIAFAAPRLLRSIYGMFGGAEDDPSIESRTDSYTVAWAFFAHHPWFGRGLGTFLPKYRIFDNQYLGLIVSIGAVGTVAFLALAFVAMVQLSRAFRLTTDQRSRDLTMALLGGIAAGFACLAFFDAFAFPMTMGGLFLLLGMGGATVRLVRSEAAAPARPPVVAAGSR